MATAGLRRMRHSCWGIEDSSQPFTWKWTAAPKGAARTPERWPCKRAGAMPNLRGVNCGGGISLRTG